MEQIINYEVEFCGKVPLNQTNMIQPHGVLLIVDQDSFQILQLSENAPGILGMNTREILSKSLLDFVPATQAEAIKERFGQEFTDKLPYTFSFASGRYLSSIQCARGFLIIEIEAEKRLENNSDSFLDVYQELKYAMAAVERAGSMVEACDLAVRELKRISGFDKIMIYRFDENWNGDVIAETREEGMDAYLGLKFPASDIPRQARELYKRTPYRLIPNVHYEPVKLYPVINPATNAFTDLSNTNLRSVAGVHLEYLVNMGVEASMSTRILVDGELWGLIACHHRRPKYLSFELCSVFELLSNVISARISAVQNQDVFRFKSLRQQLYTEVLEDMYRRDDLPASFEQKQKELLQLLTADGVSLVQERRITSLGHTPDDGEIAELVLWLQSVDFSGVYHNPALSSSFETPDQSPGISGGILALPVQPERGSFILAFRPEVVQTVNWGGNPNEAVQLEADGKNYHPRNSFRQWQQVVKGRAIPWTASEIEIAEHFRNMVVEYTLSRIYG